jgi:hypothetical protein
VTSLTGTACEAYYIYTYKYMWLFDMFNLEINKLYFQMSGYKLVSNACYVIDWGGGCSGAELAGQTLMYGLLSNYCVAVFLSACGKAM